MKKTLLFVMAAAASASLWAQNKEYKIEISVSDAQKEGKYVLRTKDLPEKFSDTITLKKDGEKSHVQKTFRYRRLSAFGIHQTGRKQVRKFGRTVHILPYGSESIGCFDRRPAGPANIRRNL